MKKVFPNYREFGVKNIKLKPKDKKILDKFMILVEGSACERRANNIRRTMLIIYDISGVGFDDWNIDVLRKFMKVLKDSKKPNSSTNDIKKILRRFLREHYEDAEVRFKRFKDEGGKTQKELNVNKINKKMLITPEELDILLRASNYFYSAYISSAMETAGRPSELLNTKWEDWDLDKGIVHLNRTKNNTDGNIPIKDCIYFMKQHKQNFHFPNVEEKDFVFASPENRKKPMTLAGIYNYFSNLTKDKLGRKLKPYICRHTRLSYLMNVAKLSPKVYERIADHSYEVGIKTYSHIDNEDVEKEMKAVLNREELTPEQKDKLERDVESLKNVVSVLMKGLKDVDKQELEREKVFQV